MKNGTTHSEECWRWHLECAVQRVEYLEKELYEQCRLLGISGSREAKLLAEVESLNRRLAGHREARTTSRYYAPEAIRVDLKPRRVEK